MFNLPLQSSNKMTMMMMMIMMTASVSGTENMDIKFVVESALDLIKQLNHIDVLALDLRPLYLNFELIEISLFFLFVNHVSRILIIMIFSTIISY